MRARRQRSRELGRNHRIPVSTPYLKTSPGERRTGLSIVANTRIRTENAKIVACGLISDGV
jgi:hypothetical protein